MHIKCFAGVSFVHRLCGKFQWSVGHIENILFANCKLKLKFCPNPLDKFGKIETASCESFCHILICTWISIWHFQMSSRLVPEVTHTKKKGNRSDSIKRFDVCYCDMLICLFILWLNYGNRCTMRQLTFSLFRMNDFPHCLLFRWIFFVRMEMCDTKIKANFEQTEPTNSVWIQFKENR